MAPRASLREHANATPVSSGDALRSHARVSLPSGNWPRRRLRGPSDCERSNESDPGRCLRRSGGPGAGRGPGTCAWSWGAAPRRDGLRARTGRTCFSERGAIRGVRVRRSSPARKRKASSPLTVRASARRHSARECARLPRPVWRQSGPSCPPPPASRCQTRSRLQTARRSRCRCSPREARCCCRVTPAAGETVLVHAGGGALGTMAVQVARRLGLRVVATVSSPEKKDRVAALGAEVVCGYDVFDAEVRKLRAIGGSTLRSTPSVGRSPSEPLRSSALSVARSWSVSPAARRAHRPLKLLHRSRGVLGLPPPLAP